MNKYTSAFLIFAACLLLSGPGAVYAKEQAENNSRNIVIEETVYNFGIAVEGNSVSHKFAIKNIGRSDLQILRVNPG